jgi:IclR family acetate operon transcriptional repressor
MPRAEPITASQAVKRALAILELFDEQRRAWTASEAAASLGVHRTTASRLLAALARRRLVEQRGGGRYVLGLGLVSLAGQVLGRLPVRDAGREIVRELRDRTGETAYLGILDGDDVIFIEQASNPHVRHRVDWVGRRQPLAACPTGAVLLVHRAPDVIAEPLREGRDEGYAAARLLTEPELAQVRADGHLARYADPLDDHAFVAAAVRDRTGEVVAAICVGAARHRVGERRFWDELVPAVLRASARVSEALGAAP